MRALFIVGFSILAAQDDASEAKLGEIDVPRSVGGEAAVKVSPALDRIAVSYHVGDRTSYVLENRKEESRPIKWIGWKMPEGKSVLLAGSEKPDQRRLLMGGVEEKRWGTVWDAALIKEGSILIVAVKTPQGIVLKGEGGDVGPFEDVDMFPTQSGVLCYRYRKQGKSRLHFKGQDFDLGGAPVKLYSAPEGSSVAWVERLPSGKQRAVVNGRPGIECDAVHNDIQFSPTGKRAAYITREQNRTRLWIDDREVPLEGTLISVRVSDEGSWVGCETWVEQESSKRKSYRGRIVVNGKREDRILDQPVLSFEARGGRWIGVSRGDEKSVMVSVDADGTVGYEDVAGHIGAWLYSPDGAQRIFGIETADGVTVVNGRKRAGPYGHVEFFYLSFSKKFAYLAVRDEKMWLVAGEKTFPVALHEYLPPCRISKTEMTAAVVGVQRVKDKKEVWVRVIPLE